MPEESKLDADVLEQDSEVNAQEEQVPISELRKVRAEAAKYRKELQALKAEIEESKKQIEREKMSQLQKLEAEVNDWRSKAMELEKNYKAVIRTNALISAATQLDAVNPQDVAKLVEAELPLDENGNVDQEGVIQIVKEFLKSRPYMIKGAQVQQAVNFGATNPPPNSVPRPKLTNQDMIDKMKQQARELTRQGRVAEATKLYNRAWELEHGSKGG